MEEGWQNNCTMSSTRCWIPVGSFECFAQIYRIYFRRASDVCEMYVF